MTLDTSGSLNEADYRPRRIGEDSGPPLFKLDASTGEVTTVPERSPLELGAGFLGNHQVVAALAAGEESLITYTVLREPDGGCHVIFTPHEGAEPTELAFAHAILLDTLRRQIDRVGGPGEAAKLLFQMAVDPDPRAEAHDNADENGVPDNA